MKKALIYIFCLFAITGCHKRPASPIDAIDALPKTLDYSKILTLDTDDKTPYIVATAQEETSLQKQTLLVFNKSLELISYFNDSRLATISQSKPRIINSKFYANASNNDIHEVSLNTLESFIYYTMARDPNHKIEPWTVSKTYVYQTDNQSGGSYLMRSPIGVDMGDESTRVWELQDYRIDYLFSRDNTLFTFMYRYVNTPVTNVLYIFDEATLELKETIDFSDYGNTVVDSYIASETGYFILSHDRNNMEVQTLVSFDFNTHEIQTLESPIDHPQSVQYNNDKLILSSLELQTSTNTIGIYDLSTQSRSTIDYKEPVKSFLALDTSLYILNDKSIITEYVLENNTYVRKNSTTFGNQLRIKNLLRLGGDNNEETK